MNLREIKELLALVVEKDLAEFELERAGMKLRIKRNHHSASPPVSFSDERAALAPADSATAVVLAPPAAPEPEPGPREDLHIIKSPIVGTFYEAPNPGTAPFVKAGDTVEAGQTLCIIEAMKLMNEIEADLAGEIVKGYVANGQPVEYGEILFSLRPRRKK